MKEKRNTKIKVIWYVCLGVFVAICLGICFYIFRTDKIMHYIEVVYPFKDVYEGKTYIDLAIYTTIQAICYFSLTLLIIGAFIKERFTVPKSKILYLTMIVVTLMAGIIECLKFQQQYISYIRPVLLIMTAIVIINIITSIVGYFALVEDEYYIKENC